MADKKYNIAVVGGAGMWGRHYLRTFAERPDCRIVALVDRARERRDRFAEHYGIDRVYDDVQDMLAEQVPDIVSAILPVSQAGPAVIACARAGVRVVSCEKPIAISLEQADEMIRVCRDCGTALGCGTAHWEVPHFNHLVQWLEQGELGAMTSCTIPGGLTPEVSGNGCADLSQLRYLTQKEVQWVEGWTLPPPERSIPWPQAKPHEIDGLAYGRLGMSGGIVCHITEPSNDGLRWFACSVGASFENGQVWLTCPYPIVIVGKGDIAAPIRAGVYVQKRPPIKHFEGRIDSLITAFDADNGQVECDGHDYRQALEIAIALNLSHARNHQRIELPLEDRSACIYPTAYRLQGGDVAGWGQFGYKGEPQII